MSNPNARVDVDDRPSGRSRTTLAAAAMLAVGSLCPWATFLGLASGTGLQLTYGWLSVIAGVTIFALENGRFDRRLEVWHRRRITSISGGLCVAVCFLTIIGVGRTEYGAAIQPAWGVYLTLIAAVLAIVSSMSAHAGDRLADPAIQSNRPDRAE